jgi:uncharacterized protein (TIGR00369 family)
MSAGFQPRDPDFAQRVRASFERQRVMGLFGATLSAVAPGAVDIDLPYRDDLSQQHGFLHAGVSATVVDSACGYAALTLMEPGTGVVSVEFKVQLLAPAAGAVFRASGRVVRAGRTLTVVAGELRAWESADATPGAEGTLVAMLSGTMMTVRGRPGLVD